MNRLDPDAARELAWWRVIRGAGHVRYSDVRGKTVRRTDTNHLLRRRLFVVHAYDRKPRSQEGKNMSDTKQSAEDLAILEQLNLDYVRSDQSNDVARFREFLAADFIIQIEGMTLNRDEYLEYIAKPRPFKDLTVHDVNIRILSDVALIHARVTLTTLHDGVAKEALYTDTYQKREGTWVCVAACAPDPIAITESA
ncbi:nuclear transport factor 2 family protein [Amycolatopsis sp. NPDC051903]|uniref:nuclear transport factor 2 family protein n=1 Tax=Amycolatopsis sp. NPDC051903 TaxID=3363936 RepID=UPI0037BBCE17